MKGVLVKDPAQLVTNQSENTNPQQVIKFTDVREIIKLESTLKEFIAVAIQIEKEGVKVEAKETATDTLPQELLELFAESHDFQKAFTSLTARRQRGYLLFINSIKQSKIRKSTIEHYRQRVLNNKEFHDCVCG